MQDTDKADASLGFLPACGVDAARFAPLVLFTIYTILGRAVAGNLPWPANTASVCQKPNPGNLVMLEISPKGNACSLLYTGDTQALQADLEILLMICTMKENRHPIP